MRRYPIGIQSFEEVIEGNYVYVDKTEYIWRLVEEGKYYFLSRPRRFGKSLLISTLEAFFKGRRNLFKGLAIDSKDYDWSEYPVFHIDLNSKDYESDDGALERMLSNVLTQWENTYGISPDIPDVDIRFANAIRTAYEKTGRKVVVLIDEYDKPLFQNLFDKKRMNRFRSMLKAFYGVLKSCDQYIRFALLTGVTKFGKVSVFSDLNNLEEITLTNEYNAICGISESELASNFKEEIETLASEFKIDPDTMARQLRIRYDGYHFTEDLLEGIYNPFSLLNVFKQRKLKDFWFKTDTPAMLVKLIEKSDTDLTELEGTERSEYDLTGLETALRDPIPVLFQSGYLTIKGYDDRRRRYVLGFPNEEVKRGFLEALLPAYINKKVSARDADIFRLIDALEDGDVDRYMMILQSFMAGIPYSNESASFPERRFSDIIFVTSSLIGLDLETERATNRGRIDLIIKTSLYIYIIEFKINHSPEEALMQIEEKGYDEPYISDGREIIKVGVEFSTEKRNISKWSVKD